MTENLPENIPRSTFFDDRRSSKYADMALASLGHTQGKDHSLSAVVHSSRFHGMVLVVRVEVDFVIVSSFQ